MLEDKKSMILLDLLFFSLSTSQIQDIVGKYGLVVISRYGHNPEKFIYESDNLTPLKVRVYKLLA